MNSQNQPEPQQILTGSFPRHTVIAMEKSPGVTPSQVRAFFAKKAARRAAHLAEELAEAGSEAQKIIAFILQHYRPLRIYQWGSLVYTERFNELSDIDIAVEGLAHPLDLHRIIDYAETVSSRSLDIVPLEEIAPEYAESIRKEGRLVYERS